MNDDTITNDSPAPESKLQRLRELRRVLLHLDKALLDAERELVTGGEV
jgi:hypothetical protein